MPQGCVSPGDHFALHSLIYIARFYVSKLVKSNAETHFPKSTKRDVTKTFSYVRIIFIVTTKVQL